MIMLHNRRRLVACVCATFLVANLVALWMFDQNRVSRNDTSVQIQSDSDKRLRKAQENAEFYIGYYAERFASATITIRVDWKDRQLSGPSKNVVLYLLDVDMKVLITHRCHSQTP